MSTPAHVSVLVTGKPLRLSGDGDGPWTVTRHAIGDFRFDGLIAGDLLCGDYNPLSWPGAPPAPHEARAFSVVAEVGPDHRRVSFVGLRFSEEPVVTWKASGMACGVDAGVAGFASAARQSMIEDDEELLDKVEHDLLGGALVDLDGHHLVLTSSGWGDGIYDIYWGLSADGSPAWAAIDFDILQGAISEEYKLALPLARGTHTVAEGIEVKVGMFAKSKPVLCAKLPQGQNASAYLLGPGGTPHYVRPKHGLLGSHEKTYDLSGHKDATTFVVTHVLDHEPMSIVD